MPYINDPRENIINPENGYVLEDDNRVEDMYKWSGKILDLCDLPVEEYMKPLTVIALGGGVLPDTGETMYTLKFIIDGVVVGQEKLASGNPIIFNVNAIKEDRTFLGWYYGDTKYEEGALMPSKNLTLTAKYECNIKFVFVVDGIENEVSAYTVAYNSQLNEIPNTDIPGFEFKGWDPSINNLVLKHTVYYGTFNSIVYTVIWNGYTDGPIKQEYKYNDKLIQPINPEKEGYTFKKWIEKIPEKVTSNLEFNPDFEVNKYVLSYHISIDGIEGEVISSFTLNYGSIIPVKNKPLMSGYTFTDWIGYNADTNELFNGTKMPAHNVKYISERTTNEYIIRYFDNNTLIHDEKYYYGATIIPYVYEKIGWTVSNWNNLPNTMPYHDVEVYCTSVRNKYTITFKDQNGKEYIVQAEYETPIKDLVPKIEGKTFVISEDILNSTLGPEDLIIEGELIVNNYKVHIEGVEGPEELPYGTNVKEYFSSNYPAKEGYHIVIESNHDTVPADDSLVVKVSYEPNIWVLSYSTTGADDNNFNGSKEVAYGTYILPELPATELEGYDFKGWFNEKNKVDENDTMPNSNLSVNGMYEIMSFIVIVKDGEVEVLNKEYTYGTKLQVVLGDIKEYRDNLYNEGYETIVNIDAEGIIKSDLEFEIERSEREFVLTFMNGENIISEENVKYNSDIKYPEMPNYTDSGTGIEYVFVWKDDLPNEGKMPNYNVIIVGNYQEKVVAPIYYGVFVTSSATPDSRIYNDYDLENHFKSVKVSECLTEKEVDIFMDADKKAIEFIENDDWDGFDEYCASHLYPSCFLVPIDIVEKYEFIAVLKADGAQKNFTSDKKPLNINGNNYYLYTYLNPESMMAGDGPQTFTYKITLK